MRENVAQVLQRQFKDVGVEAAVQLHDGTSISKLWFEGKFHAMLHWWQLPADPELALFFAKDRIPPHGRNINYVVDDALTTLVYAADRSVSQAGAAGACSARPRRAIAELAIEIPLYGVTKLDAVPARLQGLHRQPDQHRPVLERPHVDAAVARIARLAGRRALEAVPLLLVVSAIAFGLLQLVPGGPLEVYLSNPGVRPEDLDRLRRALGLDRPVWVQYVSWLAAFARGDWGYSFSDGRPVLDRVVERLPASLELLAASLVLALAAALPAGIIAAVRERTWIDRAVTAVAAAGISIPAFWLGLMLQLVFAIGLGWLPSSGRGPTTAVCWCGCSTWRCRPPCSRSCTARRGRATCARRWSRCWTRCSSPRPGPAVCPARDRLLRHALPNALAPVATVVLLDAALLVPGAVVTESVFAWPGVGSLFTEALGRRDYTVLMAMLMVSSLAVIVFNLLADVVHAWLDPRVSA